MSSFISFISLRSFLVLGNVRSWHWHIFGLGKQILLTLIQSSTCPGSAIREGRRQCPGPARAAGAVSKPELGKSQSPIEVWCSGFTLVWACISVQQRESRSLALGESQDIEADSWRCQPGSLHKKTATTGLILVVWQKRSSALFSTAWISPNDFPIHIMSFSS